MADGANAKMRQIGCPRCGTLLAVPPGSFGRKVRCGQCRQRFRLPAPAAVTDETVADWLYEEPEAEDPGRTQVLESKAPAPPSAPETKPPPGEPAATPAKRPADQRGIDVLKIDRKGVLLEFPDERLNDPAFRSAMPRRCMQCGGRIQLEAHVVIFSSALVSSVSLEAERSAAKMVLTSEEVRNLGPEQLLARLPTVPNVPPPADQPMPYWLCDMCRTSEAVSGQLAAHGRAGGGCCRLLIRNLWRAQEFIAAIGARGTAAEAKVTARIAQTTENPWDSLPLTVQHRIEQWYKPTAKETFLAYVPDRDRTRTEDGMAGLLLSSTRLIYHTNLRHREAMADQPLEFRLSMGRGGGDMRIGSPAWQVKHLRVEKDGISGLRRALVKGKFNATWR